LAFLAQTLEPGLEIDLSGCGFIPRDPEAFSLKNILKEIRSLCDIARRSGRVEAKILL